MKLNIHVNMMAIHDMYSWLKVGDYHRLPLEVHADFKKSNNSQTYIRHTGDYKYSVNAKLLKIVKKSFGNDKDYTDDYGLAYFEVEVHEYKSLYFFMQLDNNNEELAISMAHLQEGEYYTANIEFFLKCGAISSIVHGLWDDIDVGDCPTYCKRQPYALVKIDEIYTEHGDELTSLYYDVDYKNAGRFILSCTWVGSDQFGGKILDYYVFKDGGRLDFKYIGSFGFALIDLYIDKYPSYLVTIDNVAIKLYSGFIGDTLNEAIEKIVQGIFIDTEYKYQVSADFEEFDVRFYDSSLFDLKDWDETDECEANILVQFTSPYESNILTKTSLKELQEFSLWNQRNIENHTALLDEAKKNDFKYLNKCYSDMNKITI